MAIMLKDHQVKAVEQALPIMIDKKCVYLFGQPRIGKSLISLDLIHQFKKRFFPNDLARENVLVLTKKNAIKDWLQYNKDFDGDYAFIITNYEQLHVIDRNEIDFVIVDEAHNFGAFPKFSQRTRELKDFARFKYVIWLSGTPFVESPLRAYSQFAISSWSPFKNFISGYAFFKKYGIPNKRYIGNGQQVETYSKCKEEEILAEIEPYIVRVTYEDAGFKYQNTDEVIYIPMTEEYREIQNKAIRHKIVNKNPYETLVLENSSAQLQFLHRLSGGFYEDLDLPSLKLDWLDDFIAAHKDSKIAIMCYFIEEQEYLSKEYEGIATVLSSTKYCEGIDLSGYDHFILYSFGYSGAKFIQLRDRIVHLDKDCPTKVIVPLIEGGIDNDVYNAVSHKKTFNSRVLKRIYDIPDSVPKNKNN